MTQDEIVFLKYNSDLRVSIIPENLETIPFWDAALTQICRSQAAMPEGLPAAFLLADRPDREAVLASFESAGGYKDSFYKSPMLNIEYFYKIQTCIRKLSRTKPLETSLVDCGGLFADVPTNTEILRLKSALIVTRNFMRDYLDLAIFSSRLGSLESAEALKDLDTVYPLPNNGSVLVQLAKQISNPRPFDLSAAVVESCESLAPEWRKWDMTVTVLRKLSIDLFDASCRGFTPRPYDPELNK
jgi:hypothetical protein